MEIPKLNKHSHNILHFTMTILIKERSNLACLFLNFTSSCCLSSLSTSTISTNLETISFYLFSYNYWLLDLFCVKYTLSFRYLRLDSCKLLAVDPRLLNIVFKERNRVICSE